MLKYFPQGPFLKSVKSPLLQPVDKAAPPGAKATEHEQGDNLKANSFQHQVRLQMLDNTKGLLDTAILLLVVSRHVQLNSFPLLIGEVVRHAEGMDSS